MVRYQVIGWATHYENAKSKTINRKSYAIIPCRQDGVGYRRLVRDGGAEAYGAWCAMLMRLSQQAEGRDGWLTDDGTPEGDPLDPEELEAITGLPAESFATMLQIVSSQRVGWVRMVKENPKDTQVSAERDSGGYPDMPLTELKRTEENLKESDRGREAEIGGEAMDDLQRVAFEVGVPMTGVLELIREGHTAKDVKDALLAAHGKSAPLPYARAVVSEWRRKGRPEERNGKGRGGKKYHSRAARAIAKRNGGKNGA